MTVHPRFLAAWPLLALPALAMAQEDFAPVTPLQHDAFYAQPDRRVGVTVEASKVLHAINPAFLGINGSHFITTDEMWAKHEMEAKLRSAGVGAMRYPGGHETGFFHWEHPGVNGYEDLWAPPEEHGNPPYRGRFQTTWIPPEQWATNESFMDFDEFMAACGRTGMEPVVGINLSSGRKYSRQQDGIDEALRWLRYCQEKDYNVTYWFLECEPWHRENNHTFTEEEYAEDVLAYGRAIKAEFPHVKLITNPTGPHGFRNTEWLAGIIRETKEVVDFIDFHWYWEDKRGTFDLWRGQTPIGFSDRGESYLDAIAKAREAIQLAGADGMGVVILEWNLAPSDHQQTFSQSMTALVQAEILMQYLQAGVELTCLWPLVWESSRDVWPEQDFFPSIVTLEPPHAPTLTHDLFRLVSPVQGSALTASTIDVEDGLVVACTRGESIYLYCLSKSDKRRRVTVDIDRGVLAVEGAEAIAMRNQVVVPVDATITAPRQVQFHAEPFSLNAITLKAAAPAEGETGR